MILLMNEGIPFLLKECLKSITYVNRTSNRILVVSRVFSHQAIRTLIIRKTHYVNKFNQRYKISTHKGGQIGAEYF